MPAQKMLKKNMVVRTPYLASRSVPVPVNSATGTPASLDEATRSVEVVAATEEPAYVMDWDRWEVVREVLLMSGCRLPETGQVVLLDTHSRESVSRVLGSFRGARVDAGEGGPVLLGRTHYSSVRDADDAYTKVREGHVTDVSVGYEVLAHIWIEEGVTTAVEGKTYTGPMRVATEWAVRELSLCPIGADSNAKIRNKQRPGDAAGQTKEKAMPVKKSGGAKTARTEKGAGRFVALKRFLGFRAEEEETEEEARAGAELLDENGNPVAAEELTQEELETAAEEVEQILEEINAELAAQEEDPEEEGRAAKKRAGARAALVAKFPGRSVPANAAAVLERARIQGITRMGEAHGIPRETVDKLVNDGTTLSRAKEQVLDMIEHRRNDGPGFHVATGATEKEKYRAAAQDSLSLRFGLRVEKPAPGSDELRSYSLRELAREMLVRAGSRPSGNAMQIVGRALTTTDLPVLLVETSRRVLMEAFEAAPETWRGWAQTGIATDFKKSAAVGLEGDVKPLYKPEYGEYKEGKLAELAEEYVVRTFGRKMVISREAIVNDDLNALSALPRLYGEQTAELVGDVVYEAFLQNPPMGDGKTLFHADHRNIFSGKGGAPTVANLGAVVTGMKKQKDSLGKPVTIVPKFFLAPLALEVAAEQFFNTQLEGRPVLGIQASPLVHNPYGGTYFSRVYDRRLDAVSESAYYLAALRGTVTAFFLGGVETPYIETQENFDTDGVESKVRMDVGAKAMRSITMAKATA